MTSIEGKLRGASPPDRLWTFGGISSEMLPGVVSPLCWSVWEQSVDLAYRRALADFGVLSHRQVVFADDTAHQPAAPFFGRLAINVDATRELIGRIPGVSANEFERDMLGSVRDGQPDEATARGRIPALLAKSPRTMATSTRKVREVHEANRAWWERDVLAGEAARHDDSPRASLLRLEAARRLFADSLYAHIRVRFVAQGGRRAVVRLVERHGDESLAAPILGGYGGTADIAAADDVWRLANDEIQIDDFLRDHGFRGTDEGNVYARSWREDPGRVHTLVDAYRRRSDTPRPRDAERGAVEARRAAERTLIASYPRSRQPLIRWLLARAENLTRTLQLGRAGYLMAIDGSRAAARDLGRVLSADGKLGETDDVFFFTVEELQQLLLGALPDAAERVARRRATRAEYETVVLPPTFIGMPTPVDDAPPADADRPTEVSGVSGNTGIVEGRARVVLDPAQDIDIEQGDILVCRATDPGWMALLALAAGVVIDNGGDTSHGAIVSRELGIPCVIGTGNGTAVITDLDYVRVDGSRGRVEILERAAPA